ncbi:MAG: bifunctional diguanylate cyclase/phosphodiesterase [Woeseiaceae bacterium]|nr:bifunctional diguanylate cyclase/phosphodiesterase [Woeseiaceae bacterium]
MSTTPDHVLSAEPVGVQATRGHMAMIVTGDGSIEQLLQSDETGLNPGNIDDLWPTATTARIRQNLRRALRSREYFAEEIPGQEPAPSSEFIYVAQGRNKVLLIVRDASQPAGALSRMQQLAYVDDVTDLPNREFLLDELADIVDQQCLKEQRAAVIFIHIDEIEEQRGAFGHGQLHSILRELGSRLTAELRGPNAADETDPERRSIVARIDYRQFAVVLPSIHGGEDAEAVTARLTARLQEPVYVNGNAVKVRACAGIALLPQDGKDVKTLCEHASAAMEDARTGRSSSVVFHSGTVRLRSLQRQDLEFELRAALEREEFTLNFLPVVDAASGRVTAVEALLRWPESLVANQSTRKVILLAERTGLILPIGDWVLGTCCQQLRTWRDAGFDDLRLSVNLSLQEFARADLAERIAGALDASGLAPDCIDTEFTEKTLCRDAVSGFEVCNMLRSLGVGLVVDDYGLGPSSIAELTQSGVDGIKVDNTLVAQIGSNPRGKAACHAAISLAHALDLTAIAEGVETEEQTEVLTGLGADRLQGFHFCQPLEAGEVVAFLESRNA